MKNRHYFRGKQRKEVRRFTNAKDCSEYLRKAKKGEIVILDEAGNVDWKRFQKRSRDIYKYLITHPSVCKMALIKSR